MSTNTEKEPTAATVSPTIIHQENCSTPMGDGQGGTAELLSADLGECIEFPIEAMPKVLQPLIVQGAEAIQCPPDFIAVPLLACLGAAIGRSRELEIKPGWRESSLLWTVVVGRAGTAKTPAFKLATEPLNQIQERLMKLGEGTASPARVIVTNTTVEALAVLMAENPRGLILARDELAGWFRSMNQYKKSGDDEPFYLATWSGEPHIIDRKTDPKRIHIPHTYLAVTGCTQPGVLEKLLTPERHEEGFASRLLIACPSRVVKQWKDLGVDEELKKPVAALFDKLYAIAVVNEQPRILHFTKDGFEAYKEVVEDHYVQFQPDERLAAHWAKMEGYCARLSLIIHLVRYHSGEVTNEEVDVESVRMAAQLINYFKAHVARFYGKLEEACHLSLVGRILRWACRTGRHVVTVRDLITAHIVKDKGQAITVLDDMAQKGVGRWEDPGAKQALVLTPTQQSATQQTMTMSRDSS